MTNFYEELKLEKTASASEISAELVRLESVWHKREMSRPELAAEKLVQINEAKKVFATDAAKAQYDRELNAVPVPETPADPDAARRAQFQKWYQNARSYYQESQYDLAKTAIERAVGCGVNEDDTAFFCDASRVYRNNGDLTTALDYVNRAILSDPADPENYIEKAFVLEAQYRQALQNRGNAADLLRQWREVLEQAIKRSSAGFYRDGEARACGMLAFSLHFSQPQNEPRAEELARQAVKMGDRWGNAQRVLDDIEEKRAAAEKAERDAQTRRTEAERQNRERQMQLAQAEQQRQQRQNAMAEKDKKAKNLCLLGWAGVILSAAFTFLPSRTTFLIVLKTLFVFGAVALLNYADTFKNGYSSRLITAVSSVLGVAYCFVASTAAYTIMGYNARSASRTWMLVLILLAVFFVLMFTAKALGKKADQKTRF